MFSAMDSARRSPARWVAPSVLVWACASLTGCAQLSAYHAPQTPVSTQETLSSSASPTAPQSASAPRPIVGQRLLAQPRPALAQNEEPSGWPQAPTLASRWRRFKRSLLGGKPNSQTLAAQAQSREPQAPIAVALQPPRPIQTRRSLDTRPTAAGAVVTAPDAAKPQAPPASAPAPTMESIISAARARLDALTTYQVSLSRQERVGESLLQAEDVLLSIRRKPQAVRIEWPDGPHKGREVLYSADRDNGLMNVKMADATSLMPRISMKPDSTMAMSNSRHPITEAGLDTIVAKLESSLKLQQASDPAVGQLSYDGLEQPRVLDKPCHKIKRVLPNGETWVVYLDPQTKLPALVEGTAPNGDLLERYLFRKLRTDLPDLASATAFDPNSRWGQSASNLLSRLARTGSAPAQSAPTASQ
ncbi:MAG TPA: DUF1571 domain-containing protein [Isosphaeraceae bacterium]|jgi:hypothetical protein|nr:DUF1571 domain-containing protein [Isosphaeraceae bacterium]